MELNNLLSRWAQFFLTRYRTTILIIIAIIVAGLWGIFANQRQDFPTIESNYIFVQATYPGASAEDVEKDVIAPVEQAISEISHIKTIRSSTSANFGLVWVEMESIDATPEAVSEAKEIVTRIPLPEEVETNITLMDVTGPSLMYAIASNDVSKEELLALAGPLKERLESASNEILRVDIAPDDEFVVRIKLDAEELNDHGIQGSTVTDAIQSSVTSLPGGSLTTESGQDLSITINPAIQSLEELRAIEISGVALEDLAEITYEPKNMDDITLAGYLKDGEPVSADVVYLMIYKQEDGDLIRIGKAVAEEVAEIEDEGVLPAGVDLPIVYDNGEYVKKQINNLLENGLLGLILVLVVLMFFINVRTGLAVASIIPLAFLGSLGLIYAFGFTLNIIVLFGLLIVIGILVDNAIVIAEGITHRIEEGMPKNEAVIKAVKDLGPAVTAATLTTIVAFIPFATMSGIVGEFLRYIPLTIITMLVVSYILAITIMPLFAKLLFKEETREARRARKIKPWEKIAVVPAIILFGQKIIDRVEDQYAKNADWVYEKLWRKLVMVFGALALLIVSIVIFASRLDVQQFPSNDTYGAMIEFSFPATMDADARKQATKDVMEKVVHVPYFVSYVNFEGSMLVLFEQPDDREKGADVFFLMNDLRERIAKDEARLRNEGVRLVIKEVGAGPPTSNYDVIVELRGKNLDDLNAAAADLNEFIHTKEHIDFVLVSSKEDAVEDIIVELDQERLTDESIDPLVANAVVYNFFSEQTIGSLPHEEDGATDDIVVSYSDESKQSIEDIEELVIGASGFPPAIIELQDVADVEMRETTQTIQRLDQKRLVSVQVKGTEELDGTVLEQEIQGYLADNLAAHNLEAEDVVYGGDTASINDSFDNLILVFILAIIVVYLILVYQFNSFIQPGLIMFTVPLAMIGVFPGLFAVGSSFDMVSGLGVIALVGIVVNDAIVFVDYMNHLRKKHPKWSIQQIATETGRARFKPILSTSITTIFGVLPLTIFDPFWRGLGTALMTGLVCSTLGTLLVFPILLAWNEKLQQKLSRKKTA